MENANIRITVNRRLDKPRCENCVHCKQLTEVHALCRIDGTFRPRGRHGCDNHEFFYKEKEVK